MDWRGSRWAPRRTSRSPWRRARRSCAWAVASTGHNAGESRLSANRIDAMALSDTWHRTLVYFGLAEDRDAYEEPPTDAREPETVLEDRYRERPNVRRLSSRRRRDEIDDIFADDSPAERHTTRLRTVEPGDGPHGGRRESSRVHLVIPKSFNDAQDV